MTDDDFLAAWANTASNLASVLNDWATIPPDLQEHHTEEFARLAVSHRGIGDPRTVEADERILACAAVVERCMGFDLVTLIGEYDAWLHTPPTDEERAIFDAATPDSGVPWE